MVLYVPHSTRPRVILDRLSTNYLMIFIMVRISLLILYFLQVIFVIKKTIDIYDSFYSQENHVISLSFGLFYLLCMIFP